MDQLLLERAEEALNAGIVPAIAFATHRREDAVLFQQGLVGPLAYLLAAPVGVMDQPGLGLAPVNRHHQRTNRQRLGHGSVHAPADDVPRVQAHDHGSVQPTLHRPEWSERSGVVELFPDLSSPNRTCTSQRIRLSIYVLLNAKATSA